MNGSLSGKSVKLITFIISIMMLALLLAGCGDSKQTDAVQTQGISNGNMVDQTTSAATMEATVSNTVIETTQNAVEQKYNEKLDGYYKALPVEKTGTAAAAEEQKKLVDEMARLYSGKASSEKLHTLYLKGIKQLSPEQADKFTAYAISGMRRNSFEDYKLFEKYSNNSGFMEKFFKEAEKTGYHYIALNKNAQNIGDADIKECLLAAEKQGYYMASTEGMLYPLVDFTVFAKYRGYNTHTMASLIETLAIDDLDPLTEDAGFIVDRTTLAARAYGLEKMLADYHGTLYEKYLAVRFKDYMNMLFFGVNNTPAFDYETNKMNSELAEEFKNIQTLGGTFMAQLASEFVTDIEIGGGKLDDKIREKAIVILGKIDSKFGITEKDMDNYGQWMSGNTVSF